MNGYYWNLKVTGHKYDPSQPRVPAGSPEGGRWTNSGGAGKVVLPDDVTRTEYVDAGLWKARGYRSEAPVYVREADMPPVKPGHVRFYHGTQAANAHPITRDGLKPGAEVGQGERLRAVLGVAGQRSGFGEVSVVADLPEADVHMVNDQWGEVYRTIAPSEIVGVLLTHLTTSDPGEIIPIYREWMAMEGNG